MDSPPPPRASTASTPPAPTLKPPPPSLLTRLLGAPRPIFGAHTIAEAGGSVCLRTEPLLLYRLSSTSLLTCCTVLYLLTGDIAPPTLGACTLFLCTLAQLLATFSSLRYLVAPERSAAASERGAYALLAGVTVPLVHAALAMSVTLSGLYWPFLRAAAPRRAVVPEVLQYGGAAGLLVVDAVLACRMAFRVAYVALAPACAGVWLLFAWIWFAVVGKWPYDGLDFRKVGVARVVWLHVGVVLGAAVVGVVVLVVNRVNRLPAVSARIRRRVADEEVASTASVDFEACVEWGLEGIVFRSDLGGVRGVAAPLPLYDAPKEERWEAAWNEQSYL